MRTVFVLFDSLNRHALSCYGGEIDTPNFDRLAARTVQFDRHYTGSLPCMPARRDLQTGRLCFPHRSWGPLEPFDNSFAGILSQKGVHTHLVTDHFHYFEDGGAGYHTRYDTWEFVRGQEYDQWKASVAPPLDAYRARYAAASYDPDRKPRRVQHLVNRDHMQAEQDQPTPRCMAAALEFLDENRAADDWLLQLEMFDPHEPFHAPDRFRRDGDSDYTGGVLDWPDYQRVTETPEEVAEIRANYAALVRMCDAYLGHLLDYFDAHDLWADTALILTTDHGFLLSEHEWWGKCRMPYYEEVVHIPLFVHHPDHAEQAGTRCSALTQTGDIMPTLLDLHGCPIPDEVTAHSLMAALRGEAGDRVAATGIFGGPIGVTDGRYMMFHYPPDVLGDGLFEYTLNPQHMRAPFASAEMQTAVMAPPFAFTKGMPVMKIAALPEAMRVPNHDGQTFEDQGFALYDLEADPGQKAPIRDAGVETRLYTGLMDILRATDAPAESYGWYGLADRTV
ncbi:sulfatase [Marinibacterium profundimaris]|uniref:Sulfatase n=1 Tax=Marinibacterium profundimaris TaxID=1679460 RepID=A0A225NEK0_9RHOB|nr:sulfatase [Marinibacterium profundimaris]OWU70974.1 sulfatase [Marinibacterium profundimaris]